MSVFSQAELGYLAGRRLGRLATIDADGLPHVVPLGWSYNPELDTLDVGGRDLARTKKFRNVRANPKVALVIDDVLPPWQPRCVMVRGEAEALDQVASASGEPVWPVIRIHPSRSSAGASALAPPSTIRSSRVRPPRYPQGGIVSDELASPPATGRRAARTRLAGVVLAVAAAAGVWLIARYGAGMQLRTPAFTSGQHPPGLTISFVVVAAAVASLAGWGVVILAGRVARRRPRRVWITAGLAATVVSLSAPLSGHGITATQRLALVCMHLAVAAVLVPVLALTIHPSQRMTQDRPEGSGTGQHPGSADVRR